MPWSQLHWLGPCAYTPRVLLLHTPMSLPLILDLTCKGKGRSGSQTPCSMAGRLSGMVSGCILLSQVSSDSQGALSCQVLGLLPITLQRHGASFRCFLTVLPNNRQWISLDEATHLLGFTTKPYDLLKSTPCGNQVAPRVCLSTSLACCSIDAEASNHREDGQSTAKEWQGSGSCLKISLVDSPSWAATRFVTQHGSTNSLPRAHGGKDETSHLSLLICAL